MIDRIKKLMEHKKLSATQFSDEIEIQRSSLSHVLSGRNKPSLDFMLKIKNTYPEIEFDWLLLGKGNMIVRGDDSDSSIQRKEVEQVIEPEITSADRVDITEVAGNESPQRLKKTSNNEISEDKQPVKVLIFYPDNTFESFVTKQ